MSVDFSDLDDLDAAPASPAAAVIKPTIEAHNRITCPKCHGSGKVSFGYANPQVGTCFTCNGSGKVAPDWRKRKDAARKGYETQRRNATERMKAWTEANPEAYSWLLAASRRGFNFATSLHQQLQERGSLSENQVATIFKCMADDATRAEQAKVTQEARSADAGAGANMVLKALQKAADTGLRNPKLRTGDCIFTLAKKASANAGCIYVKSPTQDYLGKITPAGIFMPSRECTEQQKAGVIATMADPLKAAQVHGKMTGRCSCCGLPLSNEESVELGIGPICRDKYF